MAEINTHIKDNELLLAAEAELTPARTQIVTAHLRGCELCRDRFSELEQSLENFGATYRDEAGPLIPKPSSIEAFWKSSSAARTVPRTATPRPTRFFDLRWRALGALLAAVLVIMWVRDFRTRPMAVNSTVERAEFGSLPDTHFTPGAVRTADAKIVCQSRSTIRPAISSAVANEVLRDYHVSEAQPQNFELDYLITPELGGATDVRNLWPEPYANTEWNAHVKDQLEDRLHELVCDGRLDLPTAQHDIASNWIAAYRKYFHSSEPLPPVSARAEKED